MGPKQMKDFRVWSAYDPYYWKGISLTCALLLLGVFSLLDTLGIVALAPSWKVTTIWPLYLLDSIWWYGLITLAGLGHLIDTFRVVHWVWLRVAIWWFGLSVLIQLTIYYGLAVLTIPDGRPIAPFAVYFGLTLSDALLIILGPALNDPLRVEPE